MPGDLATIAFPPALASIEVLDDRGLRLVVVESPGSGPVALRRFELLWEVVVGFLVRGDPFPSNGASTTTLRCVGTTTPFLEMICKDSHAEPDYVAAMQGFPPEATELQHWRVSTTEASFDVAALDGPTIRELPNEE